MGSLATVSERRASPRQQLHTDTVIFLWGALHTLPDLSARRTGRYSLTVWCPQGPAHSPEGPLSVPLFPSQCKGHQPGRGPYALMFLCVRRCGGTGICLQCVSLFVKPSHMKHASQTSLCVYSLPNDRNK